ncbi:MAG: ABC transporter ATP-binding protein [Actinobacteria bacterium]|nr:ABC transporter ATP-binding protein [Actinomycetota bacterium]
MMQDFLVEIRNLRFSYPESPEILSGIDLAIEEGRVYCLMGPNGCGKSTLLDCVLGEHKPDSGKVLVDGRSITNMKPEKIARKIAYVPQIHDRSFPYTVENVTLMGRIAYRGCFERPDDADRTIALEALQSVGIAHLADKPYTQISGGEVQLVMLARALAQKTPLIVMDEPTAHLDYKNDLRFLEIVVELVRNTGTSVLVSTHSPNQPFYFESMGLDTSILMMEEGKVERVGRPSQILTEESLRELYGIQAHILTHSDSDGKTISQVVPLRTLERSW